MTLDTIFDGNCRDSALEVVILNRWFLAGHLRYQDASMTTQQFGKLSGAGAQWFSSAREDAKVGLMLAYRYR